MAKKRAAIVIEASLATFVFNSFDVPIQAHFYPEVKKRLSTPELLKLPLKLSAYIYHHV